MEPWRLGHDDGCSWLRGRLTRPLREGLAEPVPLWVPPPHLTLHPLAGSGGFLLCVLSHVVSCRLVLILVLILIFIIIKLKKTQRHGTHAIPCTLRHVFGYTSKAFPAPRCSYTASCGRCLGKDQTKNKDEKPMQYLILCSTFSGIRPGPSRLQDAAIRPHVDDA